MGPNWERTVHCLGDLHAGAITRVRLDAVSRDIEPLGPPALHLQVGDATEGGKEHEDKLARGFLDALPAQWVTALGNHDILHNDRTVADWGRAYEQDSQNFAVELDFVRVIVIGPNRNEPGRRAGRLSSATLSVSRARAGRHREGLLGRLPLAAAQDGDGRPAPSFHVGDGGLPRQAGRGHSGTAGRTPQREGLAVRPYALAAQRPRPDQAHESGAETLDRRRERVGPGGDRQAPRPARAGVLALPDASTRPPRGALSRSPGRCLANLRGRRVVELPV